MRRPAGQPEIRTAEQRRARIIRRSAGRVAPKVVVVLWSADSVSLPGGVLLKSRERRLQAATAAGHAEDGIGDARSTAATGASVVVGHAAPPRHFDRVAALDQASPRAVCARQPRWLCAFCASPVRGRSVDAGWRPRRLSPAAAALPVPGDHLAPARRRRYRHVVLTECGDQRHRPQGTCAG